MISDLYLILHKVRGQPAFDVASKLRCPRCAGDGRECGLCENRGFWWILPTSGWRAHPVWSIEIGLGEYASGRVLWIGSSVSTYDLPALPPDLPDHFAGSGHDEPEPRAPSRRAPAAKTQDFVL